MKFSIGDTVTFRLGGFVGAGSYVTKNLFISNCKGSIESVFCYSADINHPIDFPDIDFPDFKRGIIAFHYEADYTSSSFLLTEKKKTNINKEFSTI